MQKRSITLFILMGTLLLLLMGTLSACGDNSQEKTEMGVDGYVYTVCGSAPLSYIDGLRLIDGCLYYVDYVDKATLYRIPIDNELFSGEDVPEEALERAGLMKQKVESVYSSNGGFTYAMDDNGNLYTFKVLTRLNDQYQTEVVGMKLVGTGADGSVLYEVDFSDMQAVHYGTFVEVPIQADGEGNVYVLMDGVIYVVDPQGTVTDQISTVGYRKVSDVVYSYLPENLIRSQNGRIYYIAEGRGYAHWRVWEIVRGDSYEFREMEEFQGDFFGVISEGFQNPAVIGSDGFLYEYDPEISSARKILRMEDSNINGSDLQAVFQLSEEYLLAVCRVWGTDSGKDYICYLMKKTAVEDLPQKEVIVLACLYPDLNVALRAAVASFNQTSTKYHVMIESYGCVIGEPEKEEAARLRLDSALVSSNSPALLCLTRLDIYKYVSKNTLEDLAPYIEKSERLDTGDYFENIIEGYTINGKLVCVPSYFYISLFWSRISQTGSDLGWTFDDMMEMTEQYPESRLLDSADWRGSDWVWQNILGSYCVDRFVDFTGGTCDFRNEEFERIIKWAGDHHGEGEWVNDLYEDDGLLLKWEEIFELYSYEKYVTLFEDSYVLKGYPTADGRTCYKAVPTDEVGIVSVSDKKEGAWEFLEYFMSLNETGDNPGFNSRKSNVERSLEDLMEEPEYFYDPNGKKILLPKRYFEMGGVEHEFYALSREQADRLMEMLESVDFSPRSNEESAIIDIIMEETASFYNGDKSIESVMEIIQNRASLLVHEGQ